MRFCVSFLQYAALFSYYFSAMNISTRSILLALISTTVIFCGCSKKEKVERVLSLDKIQVRNGVFYEVNQEAPFTGLSQDFYPSGQKKAEVSYKDGKLHGAQATWHENGQKSLEANFKDAKKHGVEAAWYDNGQKLLTANFKDAKKHGAQAAWYESGQKWLEADFKHGKKHGAQVVWYENGQKSKEANCKDGKPHGVSTDWDESGWKMREIIFENGVEKSRKSFKPSFRVVEREPSAPSDSMRKVIEANTAPSTATPEKDSKTRESDLGDGSEFENGWGEDKEDDNKEDDKEKEKLYQKMLERLKAAKESKAK